MRELALGEIGTILLAIGLAPVVHRAARNRSSAERRALAASPVLVAFLVWQWMMAAGPLPYGGPWSGVRLAPAMSLWKGYALYDLPGRGPDLGWIYPPVAPIAYAPATLMGEPLTAIIAGRVLSLIFYHAPVVWLLLAPNGGGASRPIRWLLLIGFAVLTSQSQALSHAATEVHADAPALGLGALALGLLARSRPNGRNVQRGIAAVLATLSVGSKQMTAPLLVILPLWVLVREGRRPALRFVIGGSAAIVGVGLVALACLDARSLIFNVVTIPSRHPFRVTQPRAVGWVVQTVLRDHLVLLVLIAAGLVGRSARRAETRETGKEPRPEAWPLFLIAGLAEAPFAIMGYVKVGGDFNNLAFSLYFLAIGAFLLIARVIADRGAGEVVEVHGLFSMVLGASLVLGFVGAQRLVLETFNPPPRGRDARTAARYLRNHPGEAYFPWNPLEHLMIDGRGYHFEYGLYAREQAGFHVEADQFARDVPRKARYVVYPEGINVCDRFVLKLAGGVWRQVEVSGLPGWVCYERADGGPAFRTGSR